ncbi:MAG: hypothetical protein HC903_20055 [Methylacidiphilales bacterium]|nr:hypothetical protein [Candidatus Methylacidiphilales bacterium]NJR16104.1 hypothetical protein [Calothrix sp. CSU_2_0]
MQREVGSVGFVLPNYSVEKLTTAALGNYLLVNFPEILDSGKNYTAICCFTYVVDSEID